ncbi:MAG: exo-alpha-sialidase [Verrucomicrobia bacterium]|nr:exo-alpha-sialidase [Verrucomicrobiota bacterium]
MNSHPDRRTFLKMSALAAAAPSILTRAATGAASLPPIRRELFMEARPNESVLATTFYTRPKGLDLLSIHELMTRSDTVDSAHCRYSSDNGRTWAIGGDLPTFEKRPGAKLRRSLRGAIADPFTGRLVRFYNQALLPSDDPLEGFWEWVVYYCVSEDAGLTWSIDEEIVAPGAEFNSGHPLPGVFVGRNAVMIGDHACKQIILADGTFILPVIISPLGPDGRYYNPGGGYTYSDAAVLRGRWAADGRHLTWELSERVQADPALSTRGMDEPTVAPLADGRLLMVMRGSNDKKPALPGRRWIAYSSDQGRTWTKPQVWTYTSGEPFFSPAASSQLISHSSGRLFWLGNIVPQNPTGNRPRYPFVIGEVDRKTGLLDRGSVRTVDDRGPGDGELLALSTPSAREDRETGEIVLNMTRWGALSVGQQYNWTASAYLYHIPVA